MSCFEVCEKRFQITERLLNCKGCAREILFPKGSFFALDRLIYQSPGDSDINDRDSQRVEVRSKERLFVSERFSNQNFVSTGFVLIPERFFYHTGVLYFIREILTQKDFIFKKKIGSFVSHITL
jgi:hypothetical protein